MIKIIDPWTCIECGSIYKTDEMQKLNCLMCTKDVCYLCKDSHVLREEFGENN